jgi:hypothetical protein
VTAITRGGIFNRSACTARADPLESEIGLRDSSGDRESGPLLFLWSQAVEAPAVAPIGSAKQKVLPRSVLFSTQIRPL